MIFDELLEKKYLGMYRGQIVDIEPEVDNTKVKNGVYKVRVYPLMDGLDEKYIPLAVSNLTVRYQHIQLNKDDWVWVFFENGDYHYPVIFDLCNFKDSYPKDTVITEPDKLEYPNFDKFTFKLKDSDAKIDLELDEKNGQLQLTITDGSKNTSYLKFLNKKIEITDSANNDILMDISNTENNKIVITNKQSPNSNVITMSSSGIEIDDKTGNKITMDSINGIDIKSNNGGEFSANTTLKVKTTLADLKLIINDILSVINNLIIPGNLIGNMGVPVIYTLAITDGLKIQSDIISNSPNLFGA